jgi:hypothetical protein
MDFPLNPIAKLAHFDRTRVFVLQDRPGSVVAWETLPESLLLVFRLQPGNFNGVARRQLAFVTSRLNGRRELGEFQAFVDV